MRLTQGTIAPYLAACESAYDFEDCLSAYIWQKFKNGDNAQLVVKKLYYLRLYLESQGIESRRFEVVWRVLRLHAAAGGGLIGATAPATARGVQLWNEIRRSMPSGPSKSLCGSAAPEGGQQGQMYWVSRDQGDAMTTNSAEEIEEEQLFLGRTAGPGYDWFEERLGATPPELRDAHLRDLMRQTARIRREYAPPEYGLEDLDSMALPEYAPPSTDRAEGASTSAGA